MKNLKIRLLLIGLQLFTISIMAQRPLNVAQKQRQQAVRTLYSQAQQFAERQKKGDEYSHVLTAHFKRMESVVGLVDETIDYFSDEQETEYAGVLSYNLVLVRRSIKRPQAIMGNIYQEFLYSKNTGKLIFFYSTQQNIWAEEEVKVEYRCYYNEDGSMSSSSVKLVSVNDSKNVFYPDELQDYDGTDAIKLQQSLKDAFNALVNSNID